MALDEPIFITSDPNLIVSELVAFIETSLGKTLEPAQIERLMANAWAYRETLVRTGINDAAKQCLVAFAKAPMLDYLGQLVGVTRLPEKPATCDIKFIFTIGHGAAVIPAGMRVQSTDGKANFYVLNDTPVLVSDADLTVPCECETPGTFANGYLAGDIKNILDPQAFITSAANTTTSSGGEEQEDDDNLRERIYLAPSTFSVAGSEDAYTYWTKTADQSIIDVKITSPIPGTVNIYPLVSPGGVVTPNNILNAVTAICSGKKVRPLTDTVAVISPTPVNYNIAVDLTLYEGADQLYIVSQIQTLLQSFGDTRRAQMARDIIKAHIAGLCAQEGVYNIAVTSPSADLVIADNEVSNLGTVTVNVIGLNEG